VRSLVHSPAIMRLLGIVFCGALAAGLAVQSVALYRSNQRLSTLERQLSSLQDPGDSATFNRGGGEVSDGRDQQGNSNERAPSAFAVPALRALSNAAIQAGGLAGIAAASDDPLPLPVELASPQARQQLSSFVRAQIQREREEAQEQRRQEFQDRQAQSNNALVAKLGLDPNTAGQFVGILAQVQQQRMDVISQMRQGELPRNEIREKMQQITQKSDEQLKSLVGDDKFKVYKASEGELRQPGGAGRFGGFGGPPGVPVSGSQPLPAR
jgi:DNA-binding transcriptional regulator YdaS (Cro superfamily)